MSLLVKALAGAFMALVIAVVSRTRNYYVAGLVTAVSNLWARRALHRGHRADRVRPEVDGSVRCWGRHFVLRISGHPVLPCRPGEAGMGVDGLCRGLVCCRRATDPDLESSLT